MRRRRTRQSTSPPSAVRANAEFHTRELLVGGCRVLPDTTLVDTRARNVCGRYTYACTTKGGCTCAVRTRVIGVMLDPANSIRRERCAFLEQPPGHPQVIWMP